MAQQNIDTGFDNVESNSKTTFHQRHSSDYRNNHRSCSLKKGVLKNFVKFAGKSLCQSLFLIKL